ncbi:hypothetical protein B9Z19DRAFT_1075639 [Tuber borchii]|uniref:Uncharacterized protein n=1 Tax=Tuber borchii TaxID=42251 RepID=A0A2T7A375_TUBBO|nr:hypothetical protein B9Z19DRAFT_1075639 [Tuber borchii]
MAAVNRSIAHNTFIYSSDDLNVLLGGLWVAEGITNANLYSMMEIICIFSDTFDLQHHRGPLVERDNSQLQPGDYFVVTNGSITVTDDEVPLLRTVSPEGLPKSKMPAQSFVNAVRYRDRHCVLTGQPVPGASYDDWCSFDAVPIFPLAYEAYWNDFGFGKWITVPPATKSDGSINSPQNGILLNATAHAFFHSYLVSINPDDNYKIVCFSPSAARFGMAGGHIKRIFIDHPLRPADQLLRWHFRQTVLVNMKGAGEFFFDTDADC